MKIFLCQQSPHIQKSPSLLIFRQPQIHRPVAKVELYIPVAHFRVFFQQESNSAGYQGSCHGGAAFAGVFSGLAGTADNGGPRSHNVRLADAGVGGAASRVVDQ